ncbi:EEF1A lysine methyltransferase 2 [Coccinella septempunctata]|uniref:EEF1A lysine methyltransferase 2 n=1 Tax=Coccinella septempunctata TaxID=41139 RepID=UPI001D06E485|nr:EEF1A lysine methyltransferase 2 [Coccinella septempunctata]
MEELRPSELGTLEFWDKRYKEENNSFQTHGDPGEIWFGEESAERVINWMLRNEIQKDSNILDLGCGNGMFLIELAREGFTNLFGVDYSQGAIDLARAIAHKQDFTFINYSVKNILEGLDQNFDIINDKGTYDAISLSENSKQNRELYLKSVFDSLSDDGYFIITSCNWTESELDEQVSNKFVCHKLIPTPQFKFGGNVGSLVTTIVYKKKLK